MKHKLKEMNFKRLELMGRENVIMANQKYNTVLDESTVGKSAVRFEETERYMEHLESKVEVGYEKSTFDLRINQLEKELNRAE